MIPASYFFRAAYERQWGKDAVAPAVSTEERHGTEKAGRWSQLAAALGRMLSRPALSGAGRQAPPRRQGWTGNGRNAVACDRSGDGPLRVVVDPC